MTTDEAPPSGRPAIPDNEIIERFGGIRPMATKLGVAVTTVQGWKERGHIPPGRWQQIAASAATHGIDLSAGTAAPAQAETTPPASQREAAVQTEQEAPEPRQAEPEKRKGAAPRSAMEKSAPARSAPAKESEPPRLAPGAESPALKPGRGVAWAALILAVGLALAVLTRPYWESVVHRGGVAGIGGADPAAIEKIVAELAKMEDSLGQLSRDLQARGDAMEGRIGALEAGGGQAGTAFAGQLADLEKQMADLSRSVEALSGRMSGLAPRLATLESAQGRVPEPVQRELGEISGRVDRLLSRIEAQDAVLKARLDTIDKATDALNSRVSELEARPIQTGEKIAALALAIGQVEAALNSGRPYRSALDRLYDIGRDDPLIAQSEALAVLAPWADHGIPDRLALHRRFAQIAPQIARALAGTEEETWVDIVWNSLKGLVTIRRVDGDGELSPLSRAEIAMDRGDLSSAAAALDGTGSLGPEGNAWLSQVKARIAAETELEALYGLVIAPLAGTASAGAGTQ